MSMLTSQTSSQGVGSGNGKGRLAALLVASFAVFATFTVVNTGASMDVAVPESKGLAPVDIGATVSTENVTMQRPHDSSAAGEQVEKTPLLDEEVVEAPETTPETPAAPAPAGTWRYTLTPTGLLTLIFDIVDGILNGCRHITDLVSWACKMKGVKTALILLFTFLFGLLCWFISNGLSEGFNVDDFNAAPMTGHMLIESVKAALGKFLKLIASGAMWFIVSAKAKSLNQAYQASKEKKAIAKSNDIKLNDATQARLSPSGYGTTFFTVGKLFMGVRLAGTYMGIELFLSFADFLVYFCVGELLMITCAACSACPISVLADSPRLQSKSDRKRTMIWVLCVDCCKSVAYFMPIAVIAAALVQEYAAMQGNGVSSKQALRDMGLDPNATQDKMNLLSNSGVFSCISKIIPHDKLLVAKIGDFFGLRFPFSFGSQEQSDYVAKVLAGEDSSKGKLDLPAATMFQILAFVILHGALDLLQNNVTVNLNAMCKCVKGNPCCQGFARCKGCCCCSDKFLDCCCPNAFSGIPSAIEGLMLQHAVNDEEGDREQKAADLEFYKGDAASPTFECPLGASVAGLVLGSAVGGSAFVFQHLSSKMAAVTFCFVFFSSCKVLSKCCRCPMIECVSNGKRSDEGKGEVLVYNGNKWHCFNEGGSFVDKVFQCWFAEIFCCRCCAHRLDKKDSACTHLACCLPASVHQFIQTAFCNAPNDEIDQIEDPVDEDALKDIEKVLKGPELDLMRCCGAPVCECLLVEDKSNYGCWDSCVPRAGCFQRRRVLEIIEIIAGVVGIFAAYTLYNSGARNFFANLAKKYADTDMYNIHASNDGSIVPMKLSYFRYSIAEILSNLGLSSQDAQHEVFLGPDGKGPN